MKVFRHHIYEYKKGLRNLVLHTMDSKFLNKVIEKLKKEQIEFVIYPISEQKINVFFGAAEAVAVIKKINKENLCDYTPEEDFMLGIMLGYDRRIQCERYLKMSKKQTLRDMEMFLDKNPICMA